MNFKNLFFSCFLLSSFLLSSQENLENLLAAGLEDARTFTAGYIGPVAEGLLFNSANGWIQEATVKKPFRFDISIVGNGSFIPASQRKFVMNTADYNVLRFADGSVSKEVATAFGKNEQPVRVYSEVVKPDGGLERVEFLLPQGLASANINILPTAFLHARMGLFKATEVKLKYFPEIKQKDAKLGIFGAGIQHEFTAWLPAEKLFPVAVSGLIAYNHLGGSYDFFDDIIVTGTDQRFRLKQNSMLYQLQASTKLPVINFYGGLGYVSGNSTFDVLGTYEVIDGTPLHETGNIFRNPLRIKNKVSGIRGTLGAKLSVGFFKLHVDYTIAEFNNLSAGLHFGV